MPPPSVPPPSPSLCPRLPPFPLLHQDAFPHARQRARPSVPLLALPRSSCFTGSLFVSGLATLSRCSGHGQSGPALHPGLRFLPCAMSKPPGKRICHSKLLLTSPSASTLDQVTVATAWRQKPPKCISPSPCFGLHPPSLSTQQPEFPLKAETAPHPCQHPLCHQRERPQPFISVGESLSDLPLPPAHQLPCL